MSVFSACRAGLFAIALSRRRFGEARLVRSQGLRPACVMYTVHRFMHDLHAFFYIFCLRARVHTGVSLPACKRAHGLQLRMALGSSCFLGEDEDSFGLLSYDIKLTMAHASFCNSQLNPV